MTCVTEPPSAGRDSLEERARRLEALEGFETELYDLVNMAGIAVALAEHAFCDVTSHRELSGGQRDVYHLGRQEVDRLLFAGSHTLRMMSGFKDRYLAAMGLGG
ncbi:hypothetical protein ABLE91_15600 [Aquabacter sp. CN5-332]|uniref:hypothetical protein n=1 Tax=Aquabacter sp. CN5-332 TaxID=3156608 RepID=UPI0032B49D7D